MRYYEFRYLVEGYPQAQAAFIQAGADTASVQKTIADFKQLVTRNQIKDVNQKNIDWWAKQGWDKFNQFVNQAAAIPSKTQVVRKKLPGQSINLVDNANWFIVVPLDKEASCFHGKNSDWCTTKTNQSYFEQYFYDKQVTLIYCFNKSTGGMWAIAAHEDTDEFEMFDQQDRSLTAGQFEYQTGLDPDHLRGMALGDAHQPAVQSSRDQWKESIALTKELLSKLPWRTRSPEIEKQLIYNKNAELCHSYIIKLQEVDSTTFPLAIQLEAVNSNSSTDGNAIKYIKNPSEAVQIAAVKYNGPAIQYIENPSEAVQIAAVKKNGLAIQYIKNPSEAVQIAAVNQNSGVIKFITNPSEAVQMVAVSQNGFAIKFFTNPSEAVQLAAIKAAKPNEYAIKYIKNPSEAVQIAAVNQNGFAIDFINNPSEAVQLAAVKENGYAIKYITNPSEAVQLAAVNRDGYAIQNIKNPSEAVQLAAVKENRYAIKYIKNPTPAVKRAAGY